jgi:hypothetical protein
MDHTWTSNCISRREALRRAALLGGGLALAGGRLQAAAAPLPVRAKAVIQIWLWGGPCHLDTFDPKPGAGRDYCGPFDKPLATNVDGIQINELLPNLAKQADKYSLIRSMTHGNNGHETASYIVQTGRRPDRLVYPSLGAIVAMFKGYDHGYRGKLPPYMVLTSPQGRFSEAGFLGARYKPFATGGDPGLKRFAVEGVVMEGVSDERQLARRELLHGLDTLGRALPDDPHFKQLDACENKAYEMILGDAGKVFDLSTEPQASRDRYGMNTLGQSCLMARRLVEQGVPYITINAKGWDTHKQHFQTMQRRLPELDMGLASLLEDLAQRGLLESTIVWCGGEFGRTPKVLWGSPWNGGRGHYGNCFSALVAGGGFKGGQVLGASDKTGSEVAERPVDPAELLGTLCSLLGIDPDGPLPNPQGIEATVMPTTAKGFGRLKELV